MLTNYNLVIFTTVKKHFRRAKTRFDVYNNANVKMYKGEPQVKQSGNKITIYYADGQLIIGFDSKVKTVKFTTAAKDLLTGTTVSERGAGKVKHAINLADDTLGIDTVGTVKEVLENGVTGGLLGKSKK